MKKGFSKQVTKQVDKQVAKQVSSPLPTSSEPLPATPQDYRKACPETLKKTKFKLDPLFKLCECFDEGVKRKANAVLDNLFELSDGSLEMNPSKVDGFKPLVELATQHPNLHYNTLAVQALASLSSNSACKGPILNQVGWTNLTAFAINLLVEAEDLRIAFANLIGNSHEAANQADIIDKGIPLLLANLKVGRSKEYAAIYNALADIAHIHKSEVYTIWDGSKQFLVPSCKYNAEDLWPAISLVCELCVLTSPHAELVNFGVLERFYELLAVETISEDQRGKIALMFARIGKGSGSHVFESFPSYKNVFRLLASKSMHNRQMAANVINVFSSSDIIRQAIAQEGCLKTVESAILAKSTDVQQRDLLRSVLKKLNVESSSLVEEKLARMQSGQESLTLSGNLEALDSSEKTSLLRSLLEKEVALRIRWETDYNLVKAKLDEEQAKNDFEQTKKRRLAEIERELADFQQRYRDLTDSTELEAKDFLLQKLQLESEQQRVNRIMEELNKKELELKDREKEQDARAKDWQDRITSITEAQQIHAAPVSLLEVQEASDQAATSEREWKELQLKADEALHKFIQHKQAMQDKVETLENWLTLMEQQVPLPESKRFNELLHAVQHMSASAAKKKCFISYAWNIDKRENTKLQARLIQLKSDLVKAGIEVLLDIQNMEGDINEYMTGNIQQCDRVLLVSKYFIVSHDIN